MRRPPFVPHIAALPHMVPFIGPEAMERARGTLFRARLGANESSFGPSPLAIAAMRAAAVENWKYSDPENFDLKLALSELHRVSLGNVTVGEGIDGLLGLTCMMFLAPGDVAITTDGAYPTFNFHVQAHGGRLIKIPMSRDDREDLDALLAAALKADAKLIYVSNPNSPMGTWWPGTEIEALADRLPAGVMLVLDEAYVETAPPGTAPRIAIDHPQVLRFRTVSKAYGLAGARIGYGLGAIETISCFDKVRNHYGINRVGQVGALAALRDQAYLEAAVTRIALARERISSIATANGLRPLPSAASFVAIDCGRDAAYARAVLEALADRDVFVRKPVASGIDRCIRVSCGIDSDIAVFAEELPGALRAASEAR